METVFFVGSNPRSYNEHPRPAEFELRESPEMAAQADWTRNGKKGIRL
jgi:hypothetical protein